jgi:integrase
MNTLSRSALKRLAPGESATACGITYTKLDGDGRWSVNVMVNRVRHHVVVGLESQGFTLTQARELVAELKAKKSERRHGIVRKRAGTVTFKAAADLYLKHLEETGGKDRKKKAERLRLHLTPALGGMALASLTAADFDRYCTAREREGASPGTINRELAVVSHLFRLASDPQQMNLIAAPPCRLKRRREPEQPPTYLNPAQARALLQAAHQDENRHVYAFTMVGLHTGMRLSAILRIRVAEIDIERRVIWVDRDKAGERQQPMTAELAEFLRDYIEQSLDDAAEWLFPSTRAKSGHATNVYKAFRRVVKAAGLSTVVTPHKLRHSMATLAAHAGVDAPTLQKLGGWKSRRMVERYTHAGELTGAMDRLQSAYSADTVTQKLQKD